MQEERPEEESFDETKGPISNQENESKLSSPHCKRQQQQQEEEEDGNVLKFMDSVDSYLILMESLSSTLRQGWLDIASARHSMGALRISRASFDLKSHSAATTVQLHDIDAGLSKEQLSFTLCKWTSLDNQRCSSEEAKIEEDEFLNGKSDSPQLRHQESQEKKEENNGSLLTPDSLVQKERSKSLSMFGTLVSPKLRTSQLSFETALETVVQIANIQASMMCAHDQVQKDLRSKVDDQ